MIKTMFMQFITENNVRIEHCYPGMTKAKYIITNNVVTMRLEVNTNFDSYSISDLINLIQKDIIKILSIKFY